MSFQEFNTINSPRPEEMERASVFQEFNSIFQPIKLLSRYRKLTKNRNGRGQRIILFPGWKSHETVMFPIKNYLSKLGYAPEYWGLGFNNGAVENYRDQMIAKLKAEDNDEKITLIGWSLGGIVAREIARELPHKIASVITYGTPVIGGPKYTIGAKYWGEEESERIQKLSEELDKTNPIQTPMTIIFTKNDSIVNWSACLDHNSKNITHYQVNSTHFSLGIDPDVWKIVAMHMENLEE